MVRPMKIRVGFRLGLMLLVFISTACSSSDTSDRDDVDRDRDETAIRIVLEPVIETSQEHMEITRDIIENRVNGLGLSEATVNLSGTRIIVELPKVDDSELALSTIQVTGFLEFVSFTGVPSNIGVGDCVFTSEQARIQAEQSTSGSEEAKLSSDCDVVIGTDGTPDGPPFTTVMTGSDLEDAQAVIEPNGTRWQINFSLTDEGSQIFGDYTASNIGQRLAIVVDGVVISSPMINARITGQATIQGTFTREEAESLAIQLRYGSLPIPLEVISFEVVNAD